MLGGGGDCPSLYIMMHAIHISFNFSITDFVSLMTGAVEYKLFVGSLNKQATEMDVQEVSCRNILFYLIMSYSDAFILLV